MTFVMNFLSVLCTLATLLCISDNVHAFGFGAAGCAGGKAAVASAHLSQNVVIEGTLQKGNRTLQIDGTALEVGTPYQLDSGVAYNIQVVSTLGSGFRGALIRIQSGTTNDVFLLTAEDSKNVQRAGSCRAPVLGLTHTNANLKTSFGGAFRTGGVGNTNYTIDVTIVDANKNGVSIYWHDTFSVFTTTPGPSVPKPAPCFSAEATVRLENGSTLPMKQVALGDRVLVDDNESKYEAIYGFAKRNPTMRADYLRIGWNNNVKALEISPKHMLLAAPATNALEMWRMLPASQIQVGDRIRKDGESQVVRSIQAFTTTGAYAPLTFGGEIVVDGVMASVYVSYQSEEYLWLGSEEKNRTRIALNTHWLAHTFLTPIRWVGVCFSMPLQTDLLTWWLPDYFGMLEKFLLRVYSLPVVVSFPVVLPMLLLLASVSAVESVILSIFTMHHKIWMMAFVVIPVVAWYLWNKMELAIRTHNKKIL